MGKKYIIDIDDTYVGNYSSGEKLVLPVELNKCGCYWMGTGVPLTPYAAPDLEQVRMEAYQQGYETAKHEYEDCTKPLDNGKAYQQGLSDAWECARTIFCTSHGELEKIFDLEEDDNGLLWVYHEYTASEAIEKIHQYKQKKEEQIQVGDEVEMGCADLFSIYLGDVNGNENAVYLLFDDGSCGIHVRRAIKRKTGRHFPEIAEVLQKMKENK